jgi:subtilisin family serine protease
LNKINYFSLGKGFSGMKSKYRNVDVLSAAPGGNFATMSGTSMATPHAAGVAALWASRQIAQHGRVKSEQLMARLVASGTMTPLVANSDWDDVGTGIVQAPQ